MEGKYGLMVHWLSPNFDGTGEFPMAVKGDYLTELNEAVDVFDIDSFLREFERSGAEWLIFTIGQNTGTYASPNSVIDSLAGPGHTPNRDLVMEIANGLNNMGKRFIVYLPCEIRLNTSLIEPLGWNTEMETDQLTFQKNYFKILREWSLRYGDLVDGWWFDGAYGTEFLYHKYMLWDEWYASARAGNEEAVITFNNGSYLSGIMDPIRPEHDYTSGEALVLIDSKIKAGTKKDEPLFMPEQKYHPGTETLYHALLPIDGYWILNGEGLPDWANAPFKHEQPSDLNEFPATPIYNNDELIKFVKDFTQYGGAVTMNIAISQEGYFSDSTMQQLEVLKESLK